MNRRRILVQWAQIAAGLLVFSLGVHLTIYANIGLAPWDCLGMGVARHTPLNYGLSMTAMAVAILLIDLALKERIGFGTIIDALLTGNFVQLFNDLNPLPENHSLWLGIVIMLIGIGLLSSRKHPKQHSNGSRRKNKQHEMTFLFVHSLRLLI